MQNFDRVVQTGISPQRVGVANMQALTLFEDVPAFHEAPGQEFAENTGGPPPGSPHLWLSALIVLIVALWIVNQHFKFGPLNLMFIILTTIAGIVLLKTIFGKFHVPGLSQVVMAA